MPHYPQGPRYLSGKRMPTGMDCYACFMRQVNIALELTDGADSPRGHEIIRRAMRDVLKSNPEDSPAHATTVMHRGLREALSSDPYQGVKREFNRRAMDMYPGLKELVSQSGDPLASAIRLAIAGNIIDFGIFSSVDIHGTVERALSEPLDVDDTAHLARRLSDRSAISRVLYLLDNAGEAAMDRILIEQIQDSTGLPVTAVVKGSAVINDCTRLDAEEIGLDRVCEVVDNGSDCVGTILEMTSRGFRERFSDPRTLVISKGQGNLETLLGVEREVFFLLQSKCEVLSRVLGVRKGAMIMAVNRAC